MKNKLNLVYTQTTPHTHTWCSEDDSLTAWRNLIAGYDMTWWYDRDVAGMILYAWLPSMISPDSLEMTTTTRSRRREHTYIRVRRKGQKTRNLQRRIKKKLNCQEIVPVVLLLLCCSVNLRILFTEWTGRLSSHVLWHVYEYVSMYLHGMCVALRESCQSTRYLWFTSFVLITRSELASALVLRSSSSSKCSSTRVRIVRALYTMQAMQTAFSSMQTARLAAVGFLVRGIAYPNSLDYNISGLQQYYILREVYCCICWLLLPTTR